MIRSLFSMAVCGMSIAGLAQAADDDAIGKKLAAAKDEFQKATVKARATLIDELKKKAAAAQNAGDLKNLEKIEDEIKAFEAKGDLPKVVPVKVYQSDLRAAKAKFEEAYKSAVKEYTIAGKRTLAKTTQKDLDEFQKGGPVDAPVENQFFDKARGAVAAFARAIEPPDGPFHRLRAIHNSAKAVLAVMEIATTPDEKAAEKLATESLHCLDEAIKGAAAITNADPRRVGASLLNLRRLIGTSEKMIVSRFGGNVAVADRKKRMLDVLKQLIGAAEDAAINVDEFKKALGELPK
jgi:hypothetical protein